MDDEHARLRHRLLAAIGIAAAPPFFACGAPRAPEATPAATVTAPAVTAPAARDGAATATGATATSATATSATATAASATGASAASATATAEGTEEAGPTTDAVPSA